MNEQEDLEYLKTKIEELTKLYGDMDDVSVDDLLDDNDDIYNEYGLDLKQLEEDMNNYSTTLPLGYQKLQQDVKTPSYNYGGDSGFDLYLINKSHNSVLLFSISYIPVDPNPFDPRSLFGISFISFNSTHFPFTTGHNTA